MSYVRFDCSKEEKDLIKKIALRAKAKIPDLNALKIAMDVCATHLNGNSLRLEDLLKADDFNFFHDVMGIHNCIDRTNGKLKNNFLPRFSKRRGL
jgi:hypothetical protein